MLLGGNAGHRLKPVGIVGRALIDGPFLHLMGNDIGQAGIQILALLNGLLQLRIHLFREALPHDAVVKDVLAKNFRYVNVIAHNISSSRTICSRL